MTAKELANIYNFMRGNNRWMPFQDIKAKTDGDGILRFRIVVPASIVDRISTEAALDAIRSGMLR